MKKPAILLSTGVAALALAGAVGVGVATAGPTASPTPAATATPTAGATPSDAAKPAKGTKKHRDLTARALHGEVTLGGKKHQVVDFQRGTVTAVSGTSVTVTSKDGFVGVYAVDAKTRVRVAKKAAAIADVGTGDRVRVVAVKDGQALTATRVADAKK